MSAANTQLLKAHCVFNFEENVVKTIQTCVEPVSGTIAYDNKVSDGVCRYLQSIVAVRGESTPSPVEFQDNLLGPRFLWVLQAFLRDQVWVQSDEAMSVLELYVFSSRRQVGYRHKIRRLSLLEFAHLV